MLPDNVVVTDQPGKDLSHFLEDRTFTKIGVLVDENTLNFCYPLLQDILPAHHLIEIESGEENKNLESCISIWAQLTKKGFDRKSLLINLGGGVIGDMGGFCAATFKRGIQFINLPTTLLAQVDASIGGKLGIDFQSYKNHIGIFQDPEIVYIYPDFIHTLPERELRSGFAEVIKHALIADTNYWKQIMINDFADQDWEAHIIHSIQVKQRIVDEDPREIGIRKILNFGHTLGHAVESHFLAKGDSKLLHGEAIAVGMIAEAFLSRRKCGLKNEEMLDVKAYLTDVFGRVELGLHDIPAIIEKTSHDKKNTGGKINFTLLESIGLALYDVPVDPEEMEEALLFYNS